MTIKTIITIGWILYALLNGRKDGFCYHHRNTSIQQRNEKYWIYLIERFGILCMIYTLISSDNSLWNLGSNVFVCGLVLIFPFIHNGMYFLTRNKLSKENLYRSGWWSSNSFTEPTLGFNNISRIFLAITG